jgi:hypothetical protein
LPFKNKQKKNISVHSAPKTRAVPELVHEAFHQDEVVVPEIENVIVEEEPVAVTKEKIGAKTFHAVEMVTPEIIIVDKVSPKKQPVELSPIMTVTAAPKITFVMEKKTVAETMPVLLTAVSVAIVEEAPAPVVVMKVVEVESTAVTTQAVVTVIPEEEIAPVAAVTDIIAAPVKIFAEIAVIKQEAIIVAVPETVSQEIIPETVVEKTIIPSEMIVEETIETIAEPVKELWPKNAAVISQSVVVTQPKLVIENDVTEIIKAVVPEVMTAEELPPVPMTTKTDFIENFPQDVTPILLAPTLVDNASDDFGFKAKTHDMKQALHMDFHETSFMYVGGAVVLPLQREEKSYWDQLFEPAAQKLVING